ncbi:MAG: CPBP family intramembrane metalloprotease [Clostridia bacterium]|nr:CPBP family intramembrane metalloprotease [Clostridia bacterium]MBO5066763.1 CPBP family intramembrane metalloprotease [Clostridia bacterium]
MEFNPNPNINPDTNPINTQTHSNGYPVPDNTQPQYSQPQYAPPSVVYQNTYNNGSAPQYHYGNPMPFVIDQRYYQEQQQKLLKRNAEKQKISKIGNLMGASLVVCLLMASVFSVFLVFLPNSYVYGSNFALDALINIFYSVVVVGLTFFVFGTILKKIKDPSTQNKPYSFDISYSGAKNPKKTALLIFMGFGGCMAANYITSILIMFMEALGFDSGYTSMQDPSNIYDIIIMFIGTAIIPPFVEEYAMRGVVLSALTKHSKALAIFGSAFMFGLFHGNFTQIPFAFMCGLVFAYITIITNSIWPAVIVHAFNNSLSCIDAVLRLYFDSGVADIFYYAVSIGALVIGLIAFIIYFNKFKSEDKSLFKEDNTILTAKEKTSKFLLSPIMIVATVLYVIEAAATALTASML